MGIRPVLIFKRGCEMKMRKIIIEHYQAQVQETIVWEKHRVCFYARVCDPERLVSLLDFWGEAEAKNGMGHSPEFRHFRASFPLEGIH
jgi:hypothetical protein